MADLREKERDRLRDKIDDLAHNQWSLVNVLDDFYKHSEDLEIWSEIIFMVIDDVLRYTLNFKDWYCIRITASKQHTDYSAIEKLAKIIISEEYKLVNLSKIYSRRQCDKEQNFLSECWYGFYIKKNIKANLTLAQCIQIKYMDWIMGYLSEEPTQFLRKYRRIRTESIDLMRERIQNRYQLSIDLITQLSGAYYESTPCKSKICFLNEKDLPLVKDSEAIELHKGSKRVYFRSNNLKQIRKLLEIGKRDHSIVFVHDEEKEEWYAQRLIQDKYVLNKGLILNINAHMSWSLSYRDSVIINYHAGIFDFECSDPRGHFETIYKQIFGRDPNNLKKCCEIFEGVREQEHGAVMICLEDQDSVDGSKKAEHETERLVRESTGTRIEPKVLSKSYTYNLTSVDGAILIDAKGTCYGFGIILDGNAKIDGDRSRGARYNSTKRYIKTCEKNNLKAIGVVRSEDGMIDIFYTNPEGGR